MKHFRDGEWYGKMNFVDENNVVVGWDATDCCCEAHEWFWHRGDGQSIEMSDDDLLPYRFDPDYFVENPPWYTPSEEGGEVVFRLTADGLPDLFLSLRNDHNGYYSHGFTVEVNGTETRSGSL